MSETNSDWVIVNLFKFYLQKNPLEFFTLPVIVISRGDIWFGKPLLVIKTKNGF